jgi:hypothetical protein
MPKQAISVTLEAANLTWVRGRALAAGRLSVSEMLDRLIREARAGGKGADAGIRSVVGTLQVAIDDPELMTADAAVRSAFARSLGRAAAGVRHGRPGRPGA